MDLISPAEYARHAGISRMSVSRQIAVGKIPVYSESGQRVGPDYAGRKLVNAAEADRARGQARVRVNLDDEDAVIIERPNAGPQAATQADPAAPRGDATLTRARTASEAHRAQLLRLELDERRGRLIPVEDVEAALVSAGEAIVRVVDQLPAEVEDLAAAFAFDGVPAVRQKLKEIARRMRERIADALVVHNDGSGGEETGD
jgi:hypothetical protein